MLEKNKATDLYIKRLLGNRYQIKELIGKWSLGRGYQAENTFFGAWYKAHKHQQPLSFKSVNDNLK